MNTSILLGAALYWLSETIHFHGSAPPQSDLQVIADGIVMILAALAVRR